MTILYSIKYKQQVKDHLLEKNSYMVPTKKQLAKVFAEVLYKYDVNARVLNKIIAHNNDSKVRGKK